MVTAFDLNLRHLDAVVAIARLGSISSASAEVNLSQPALTQGLAKMERLLGDDLFDRQPSGAVPTPQGALFTARAERALALVVEAGRLLRRGARLPPIAHLERRVSMIQLRALATVERAGSYALAARETHFSQPSVHRAVKELELILGLPLLVRTGRTMRATAAAERIVRAIRLAASELQAGLDELQATRQVGAGHVAIGSLPLARATLLPSALADFSAAHPHARIRIVEGPYGELKHVVDLYPETFIGVYQLPQSPGTRSASSRAVSPSSASSAAASTPIRRAASSVLRRSPTAPGIRSSRRWSSSTCRR